MFILFAFASINFLFVCCFIDSCIYKIRSEVVLLPASRQSAFLQWLAQSVAY